MMIRQMKQCENTFPRLESFIIFYFLFTPLKLFYSFFIYFISSFHYYVKINLFKQRYETRY